MERIWKVKALWCSLWLCALIAAAPAWAVPETSSVRVTDVTPTSFSVVWITDVAADPAVEVYTSDSLQGGRPEGITITSMPAGSAAVSQAARQKGIMKVRVTGLQAGTHYYVRTVTSDPANLASIGYSTLLPVTTAVRVAPYRIVEGSLQGIANDLAVMAVYLRPADQGVKIRLGDLLLLDMDGSSYPVSSFAGDGVSAPEGLLDLNNLFDVLGVSRDVSGGERMVLRIYRGQSLPNLQHYRRTALPSGKVAIAPPVTGFFADINLDGAVDEADFAEFRKQYRTAADDVFYNPDYNFVEDAAGTVDVREFSLFAKEYGRRTIQ